MLRSFSDTPVLNKRKLLGNKGINAFDLDADPMNVREIYAKIAELAYKCGVEERMHATLKLQINIEDLEKYFRPENISIAVWRDKSPLEKWEHFFRHPKDYILFSEFIESVNAFNNNDPKASAKLVLRMRSALKHAVRYYASWGLADEAIFRDEECRKLIECFNEIDIPSREE